MNFEIRILILISLFIAVNFNAQNAKNDVRIKKVQQDISETVDLLKELYPMNLSDFKKRAPSLSQEEKEAFLGGIIQPGMVQFFTQGKLGDLKNVAEREKFLFLAPKMPRKSGAALYWAYKNNDKKAIAVLKQSGYSPSEALQTALMEKDERVISALLREGVEVNVEAIRNLLMGTVVADEKMYEEIKKILKKILPKVKNINQLTNNGRSTILRYAPNAEVAKMLFDAGLKINIPLDKELLASEVERISFFNAQAKKGNPIAENAVKNGKSLIQFFLEHNLDPAAKNDKGKSAIDIAKEAQLEDVLRVLENSQRKK